MAEPHHRRVSLNRPDLKFDPDDPPGFRCGMWRFGESLGAERVGTTLYELPPGEAVCPYHYELPAEEWLLVLDGNPTVREPDGEYRLKPMDVAFFAPGPRGAHQVRNDTATVRVLMWGEIHLVSDPGNFVAMKSVVLGDQTVDDTFYADGTVLFETPGFSGPNGLPTITARTRRRRRASRRG
jgi:uncharacterized cupin superfamily protein